MPPPLHQLRARSANLQTLLLRHDGRQALRAHRSTLHAVEARAREHPQLRTIDLRALRGNDPMAAAHTLATLTVDKQYDRQGLSFLADQLATMPAGLDAPMLSDATTTQLTTWFAERPARERRGVPYLETPAYKRFANHLGMTGLAGSLISAAGLLPWGPLAVASLVFAAPTSGLAMTGALAATAITSHWVGRQWTDATRALADLSRRGDLTNDHFAQLFAQYGQDNRGMDFPGVTPLPPSATPSLIEASRGVHGAPYFSKAATWMGLRDFAFIASLVALGRQTDPMAWYQLSPPVSIAMLNHLGWDPIFIAPERIANVQRLYDGGEKIIFVSNHRSYYDILAICAVLRGFQPSIIAKKELTYMPWLGRVPYFHPYQPWRWFTDSSLVDSICIRRSSRQARAEVIEKSLAKFRANFSIAVFGPGTRTRTIEPGYEAGVAPFKTGAINIAEAARHAGMRVTFVPVHIVGLGSIFGENAGRLFTEGLRLNQPVALGFGEPLSYAELRDRARAHGAQPDDARTWVKALTRQLWAHNSAELLPLQHLMRSNGG